MAIGCAIKKKMEEKKKKVYGIMEKLCPICNEKGLENQVEYLGVIVEKDNNYKLFKCNNMKGRHKKKLYYKESKKDKKKEILFAGDLEIGKIDSIDVKTSGHYGAEKDGMEYDKKFEAEKKALLRSRLKCPKCIEHTNTPQDHEYIYTIAMGNKDRFYCRNHKGIGETQKNTYEFRYSLGKTIKTSLRGLMKDIDEDYYEMLYQIYIAEKGHYNINKDEDRLVESLILIGFTDSIIGKIFHVDRSTIYRLRDKKRYKKEHVISVLKNDTVGRLFYTSLSEKTEEERELIRSKLVKMKIIKE